MAFVFYASVSKWVAIFSMTFAIVAINVVIQPLEASEELVTIEQYATESVEEDRGEKGVGPALVL